MKKVLVLGTGGTIASDSSEEGLLPTASSPAILNALQGLKADFQVDYKDILNLDSSNIQAEEWITIADSINEALPVYDGVIVLHGTDTMAYSASMISYMLIGVNKPIVFTGSQTPMGILLSDAPQNLALAFSAVEHGVKGVTIAFNNKLIQGTRGVKVRTKGFNAFESINAPYRGEVFADGLEVYSHSCGYEDFIFSNNICNDVFLLKLIPGTNPSIFEALLNMNYKGIVIETFGAGGMHYLRRDLLSSITKLIDHNIAVAVCSQCLYEESNLSIYQVGKKLLATGVIPTGDMTSEAIVTKLMWALGKTRDLKEITRMFGENYAGEITLK